MKKINWPSLRQEGEIYKRVRDSFFTGLIVILPIWVTLWILMAIFNWVDALTGRFFTPLFGFRIPGLGLLITFFLVCGVGALARNIVGRRVLDFIERFLEKTPLLRHIFRPLKQMVDFFASGRGAESFKRVVLVEYPRKGIYAVGFITRMDPGNIPSSGSMVSVFLPTSPNPTSGYFVFVPKDTIIPLNISVEEGLKLVVSGGVLTPWKKGGPSEDPSA